MTTSNSSPLRPHPVENYIRDFLEIERADVTPETAERYESVISSLFDFLDQVDVRARLGPEIADHLEAERARLGSGAFLPTLGVISMLRMMPEFLVHPWLPPMGAQRRAHRAIVDRLLVFLRRRELVEPSPVRADDFARARRAVTAARVRDYWRQNDEPVERVSITVELSSRVLDPLLTLVEKGERGSLASAIEQQLEHRQYFPAPYR